MTAKTAAEKKLDEREKALEEREKALAEREAALSKAEQPEPEEDLTPTPTQAEIDEAKTRVIPLPERQDEEPDAGEYNTRDLNAQG